jgi:cytochrome c553
MRASTSTPKRRHFLALDPGTGIALLMPAAGTGGLKRPCGDEFKRGESSMKITKLIVALIILPLLAVALLSATEVRTKAAGDDFDAAAVYKAKCTMCHGAKAEKKFDPSKPEEELIQAILKGKDGTPKMPGFESKGINAEQAKALAGHMKSLKQ